MDLRWDAPVTVQNKHSRDGDPLVICLTFVGSFALAMGLFPESWVDWALLVLAAVLFAVVHRLRHPRVRLYRTTNVIETTEGS